MKYTHKVKNMIVPYFTELQFSNFLRLYLFSRLFILCSDIDKLTKTFSVSLLLLNVLSLFVFVVTNISFCLINSPY